MSDTSASGEILHRVHRKNLKVWGSIVMLYTGRTKGSISFFLSRKGLHPALTTFFSDKYAVPKSEMGEEEILFQPD